MQYDIATYNKDPTCNMVMNLKLLGWDPLVTRDYFELRLDV